MGYILDRISVVFNCQDTILFLLLLGLLFLLLSLYSKSSISDFLVSLGNLLLGFTAIMALFARLADFKSQMFDFLIIILMLYCSYFFLNNAYLSYQTFKLKK